MANSKDTTESQDVAPISYQLAKGRNVLIFPRISEKAGMLATRLNKYVFKVTGKINKVEVKKAIEKIYNVHVTGVNMVTVKGKARTFGRTSGRTSGFKKAVVTLKEGEKIDSAKE